MDFRQCRWRHQPYSPPPDHRPLRLQRLQCRRPSRRQCGGLSETRPYTNALSKLKGSLAGADLTRLPSIPQTARGRSGLLSKSDGSRRTLRRKRHCLSGQGFLSTVVSPAFSTAKFRNNYLTSRQDLLRYVRTQNAYLAPAAPLPHHVFAFSERLDLDSAGRCGTYRYKTEAQDPDSWNRDIPNVRFGAVTTIEHYNDEEPVRITMWLQPHHSSKGDFPWPTRLAHALGPLASILNTAIRHDFGLVWDSSRSPLAVRRSKIHRRDQDIGGSRGENREPNFLNSARRAF